MIGQWGGVPLRTFLERVGADLGARYVGFYCDDPISYTTSIDMASALHPQTILCLTYAGKPIEPKFGAPMRVEDPDQARLQAAEVRDRDPRDERLSGRLLGELRLQLVCRALIFRGSKLPSEP